MFTPDGVSFVHPRNEEVIRRARRSRSSGPPEEPHDRWPVPPAAQ